MILRKKISGRSNLPLIALRIFGSRRARRGKKTLPVGKSSLNPHGTRG
jgi:hypothetical protein